MSTKNFQPRWFLLKIAFRYLKGKRSSQAIHWITGIAVIGIAVGTAALTLVLSVFNGLDSLLSGMFSKHNPDIKIVSAQSKYFQEDISLLNDLMQLPYVSGISRTYEEVCMFQYGATQEFGIIRGVDSEYASIASVHEATVEGQFQLNNGVVALANVGSVLRNKLGISIKDFQEPLRVYLPGDQESGLLQTNYQDFLMNVNSVFSFHQETDYNTVITDIDYLRQKKKSNLWLSSLDVQLRKPVSAEVIQQLEKICGPTFQVKDRYRQDEAMFKIMRLEKWLYYALFCLTLLLVSFTIVGALWMIVIDKRFDISVLKSMGMSDDSIRKVFILLGWMICFSGLVIGFLLAMGFYLAQREYGLIGVPSDYVIDSYPMEMRIGDFFIVTATVMCIGWIAAYMPSRKVGAIKPVFHEE